MRDLSLHIIDLVQNSMEAQAKNVELIINEDVANNLLTIVVEDDGRGMDEQILNKVKNPFTTTRTTRKVGLGLPLIDMSTRASGGKLDIFSKVGEGTKIVATYGYSHIDRPPLGDIVTTVKIIVVSYQSIRFFYRHIKNNKEFLLDTMQMREILGEDADFSQMDIRTWLEDYIREGLKSIDE